MNRFRSLSALAVAMLVGGTVAAAFAEEGPGGPRRGGGRGMAGPRDNMLGLLAMERVKKDLNLTEDQVAKVNAISEELRGQSRQEFEGLRGIQDPEQRRAKMAELAAKSDRDARAKLADVLSKEQLARLDQIRIQSRPIVENLALKEIADQLKLTDEQKAKLEQIGKDMRTKQSEIFSSMRDASPDQRGEISRKLRALRGDSDKQALELLTAEQKEAFEKMQGKKIDLQPERRRR